MIGERRVGREGDRCLLVAEIGPNHNGDPEEALRLIDAAREAGCDAVKFQYRMAAAELFDRTTKSYYYDEPRFRFIERVQQFPHETHEALRRHAAERGLLYICSAMCEEAVGRIAELDADAIKIPSGEVGNPWLLGAAAEARLPVVASSGMSPLDEIDRMMETLGAAVREVVLLHCLSEYPTAREDMQLRLIPRLRERYGCPVGLSDHSRNIPEVAASVALGAAMIEVHFTLDREAIGPDHGVSLLPDEMAQLVAAVRGLEAALGQGEKLLGEHATSMRGTFTNSIVARRDIRAGETLCRENLALKKPGTGLDPSRLPEVLGRQPSRDVPADTPIRLEDLQ